MSLGSLGRLGIEIYADTAQFTGALGKADTAARSWAQSQTQQFKSVEYAALGVAAAVGAYGASLLVIANEQVKMAARLDDMAEKTGATVESLSAMANVARVSGQDLGALEGAMAKLAKGIAGTDEETKGAAGALKYLGISARDAQGNLKDTGTLTGEIAKAMTGYADGTGKAALAQALFGKSGAELLPFLKDLATSGDNVVKVTGAQAAAAENYEKSLKRLTIAKEDLVRTVTMEAVPVLTTMAEMLLKSKTAADGTLASAQKLAADGSIREWAEKGAYSIAFMVDSANALKTVIQAAGVAIAGDIRLAAELANLVGNINNPLAAVAAAKNMVTIYKDTEDQLQRVLAGHKSIRFELDAQLAKAREVDALVAKYADPKYKDARDLRRPLQADYKPPAVVGMKHEAEAYLAVLDKIFAHESGLAGSYQKDLDTLYSGFKRNKLSTDDYVRAVNALIQQQPFVSKAAAEQNKSFDDAFESVERERLAIEARIRSARQMTENMEFEVSLLGLSNTEREVAIRLRELEASGIERGSVAYEKFAARIRAAVEGGEGFRQQMQRQSELVRVWDSLGESAGRFFSDLVTNGKDAFSRLRDSLKSFAAELIALFAKKWLLNMAGNFIPGQAGVDLLKLGANAGQGTMAGTVLGSPLALLAATAAGGYGIGNFGAKALGAGERGQQVGGITGALFGGIVGAIIGKFTDPNGPANRTADFGGGKSNYWWGGGKSAFGDFGITNDKWFSDKDMLAAVQAFQSGLAKAEDAFAKFLKPEEIQRVTDALAKSKNYSFGTEHTDFSGTLGEILRDRVNTIFESIDPALKKWLDSFQGTGDELVAYATDLLNVRNALADGSLQDILGRIPDLTLDTLSAMQQAGETLGDTLQRVVNAFVDAQNNLNSAIAARNPQFARDLVLGQRNNIGVQFAQSLGLDYGGDLAARMALHPESFTGLTTNQMSLLAQWLGLQTQLEQLDAQLGQTSNAATNVSVSFNNAADAAIAYANALHDAQGTLAGYLRGSLLSDLSPLTTQEKYNAARDQFNAQLSLARGGDVNAISGLGSYRDAFLNFSRQLFASSGQYNSDFFTSYNSAAALTGGQAQPYTTAAALANTQQIVSAVQSASDNAAANTSATLSLINLIANGVSMNDPEAVALLHDIKQQLQRTGGVTL